MIERAAYTAMAEQAIEKFQTLSAILPYDTEIVYVISREVYEAMQAYEHQEHTRVDIRQSGIVGIYYGTRLALINEDVVDNFFTPVIYSKSFQHYDGLRVDDFVIFNDEDDDHIFRLARLTPDAMYTDTGLTVNFVFHDIATIDNTTTNYADNAVTIGNAIEELGQAVDGINEIVSDWIAQLVVPDDVTVGGIVFGLNDTPINAGVVRELTNEVVSPAHSQNTRSKKRASKEKELNPGDTKLLDEYLHSYLKGGC